MAITPCVNSLLTDKYLGEIDKAEIAKENFLEDIKGYLSLIESSLDGIRRTAKHYEGFDFDETILEAVGELLWLSGLMKYWIDLNQWLKN